MKTYLINEENLEKTTQEIIYDLNSLLKDKEIESLKYGSGKIQEVLKLTYQDENNTDIIVSILFNDKIVKFSINQALKFKKLLCQDNEVEKTILEYSELLNTTYSNLIYSMKEKELELENAKKEEEKRKAELELQAIKFEEKKTRILELYQSMFSSELENSDSFYKALGWLTKHIGSIHADIPDFTKDWFENTFGLDAPKTIIDSSHLTSNGNSMKWYPTFTISVKKLKEGETVPYFFENRIKDKHIYGTQFIYDLITNYGFTFGKKQDKDLIVSKIPTDKVKYFELGFSA